jgi:hypothetical protein
LLGELVLTGRGWILRRDLRGKDVARVVLVEFARDAFPFECLDALKHVVDNIEGQSTATARSEARELHAVNPEG